MTDMRVVPHRWVVSTWRQAERFRFRMEIEDIRVRPDRAKRAPRPTGRRLLYRPAASLTYPAAAAAPSSPLPRLDLGITGEVWGWGIGQSLRQLISVGWRGAVAPATAAAILSLWAGGAGACDDFAAAPSSRWSVATSENGPVLLTPCGDPFFSLGVNAIDGGFRTEFAANPERAYRWQRFAGTRAEWAAATRRRLVSWGFNTAGAWSVPPGEIGLPSTPELELGRNTQFVWTDPFDPAVDTALHQAAAVAVAPYRGNPLRIGYFSDNEIGWWNGPLFVAFLTFPRENHTKQRLVAMLREHYRDDWHAFERDFVSAPGTADFDDLLAARTAPRLRPGGNGITAVRAWTAIIAGRYYSAMRQALRDADPEALYLGDRLPIYYDPDAVRAMVPTSTRSRSTTTSIPRTAGSRRISSKACTG